MATKKQASGADIVAEARSLLGIPYLFGGTNPKVGLDCSGLVLVICQRLGISCPRTSEEQFGWGIPVAEKDVSAGDLAFFVGDPIDPPPGHEGIVVSPGRMINAPFTGTVVRYDTYSLNGQGVNRFMGYRRIPHTTTSFSANSNLDVNAGQNPGRVAAVGVGGMIGSGVAILFVAAILILAAAAVIIGGMIMIRS